MGKSLFLGRYAGIPVYVHWTFGFILLFMVFIAVTEGMIWSTVFWFVAYIFTLFFCVILHEFGHALAARRYGVATRDIIISPIGGVARMESMPSQPWKEVVIAIAGPMVNAVIAIILASTFFFIFNESFINPKEFSLDTKDFEGYLRLVIVLNMALFVFNLVPAFPMDGGRILRALLSMKWGRVRATLIASYIGRVIAVVFLGVGIWLSHWTFCFIGIFVYYMAQMENKQTQVQGKLESTSAGEIMTRNYTIIFEEDSTDKVIGFYNSGMAKNFLVFNQAQNPVGSLPELFILNWIKSKEGVSEMVVHKMSKKVVVFSEKENLLSVFERMNTEGLSIVGIKNGEQITGVIDRHLLNSFLNKPS